MLSANFIESEVHLIVQGLDLLLAIKREAFSKIADSHPVFTNHDFGIPQIVALQSKIVRAMVLRESESEVSA